MDYEQKFKIGDIVKGIRTFNGEIIEGKFNGFCLHNQLNPTSVIGVIMTHDGCYDVSVDSIEFAESEDEKIRKDIIAFVERNKRPIAPVPSDDTLDRWIAWIEKQGEKSLSTEETELNSLAFLTELGYTCIPPKKEEELTEFEKVLSEIIDFWQRSNNSALKNTKRLKSDAWKLLDLARKEVEKDIEHSAVEFAKSYMEDVNSSFEKVKESEELWKWKMSCLRGINKAYKQGKQDVLKDFPKWKRSNSFFNTGNKFELGKTSLRHFDGYEIPYSELEKLPKE